jgi:hypothetical protein
MILPAILGSPNMYLPFGFSCSIYAFLIFSIPVHYIPFDLSTLLLSAEEYRILLSTVHTEYTRRQIFT